MQALPIEVFVRLRGPACPSAEEDCVSADPQRGDTLLFRPAPAAAPRAFAYSQVFDKHAGNALIYGQLGLVGPALQGINVAFFCYGPTGTGKTHTLTGAHGVAIRGGANGSSAGAMLDSDGVTQLLLRELFSPQHAGVVMSVSVSHLEIYNEKVFDLLNNTGADLRVRENRDTGPFVESLTWVRVEKLETALQILAKGLAARSVAETQVNGRSSRSHAVFQIQIQTRQQGAILNSKISLVDLAGSERTSKTNATGLRLKEANAINTSLMTLGLVINALSQAQQQQQAAAAAAAAAASAAAAQVSALPSPIAPGAAPSILLGRASTGFPLQFGGATGASDFFDEHDLPPSRLPPAPVTPQQPRHQQQPAAGVPPTGGSSTGLGVAAAAAASPHIPYRNSILTYLLKDSLGGNSRTIMLTTIDASRRDAEETLSTLRFADRAKTVVNHACQNEDPASLMVRALRKEVEQLKARLAETSSRPHNTDRRFSVDALHLLNNNNNAPPRTSMGVGTTTAPATAAAVAREQELLAQLAEFEDRAIRAETESRERAELLWNSAQQLQQQMEEAIMLAREETTRALERQEQEEIAPLVEEASALRIQVAWQRFLRGRDQRQQHQRASAETLQRLNDELASLRQENAALKIQSLRHYRHQRQLAREADKMALETNKFAQEAQQAAQATSQQLQRERELALREKSQFQTTLRELEDKFRVVELQAKEEALNRQKASEEVAALWKRMQDREADLARARDELSKHAETKRVLMDKVTVLQSQLSDTAKTSEQERTVKREELERLKAELAKAEVLSSTVSKKNAESMREVESLRLQVTSKEKALKDLQEASQAKRAASEKESEELRKRVSALETLLESTKATTQRELEERNRKLDELQKLNEHLVQSEAEARHLRESETNALRERVRALETTSVDEMEKLNAEIRMRDMEARNQAAKEMEELTEKVRRLERQLQTTKTIAATGDEERQRQTRELQRLNQQLEARELEELKRRDREMEEMQFCIQRLEKELETAKTTTARELDHRERKLAELQRLNEALVLAGALNSTAQGRRANATANFTTTHRASGHPRGLNGSSVMSVGGAGPGGVNASVVSQSTTGRQVEDSALLWQDALMCARVDVETFDEKTAGFFPVESVTNPADGVRVFKVKGPLYDLKLGRWSRIVVRVLHSGEKKVREITGVTIEHQQQGGGGAAGGP